MWKKYNMETTSVTVGGIEVKRIKIDGYLDSSTFPKLQEHLTELLGQGFHYYLLDLQDLDYISSAGLGVLMGMLRDVREHQGDLKIINMTDKIERVFNLLGFSRLMKVYPHQQAALDSFAQETSAPTDEGEEDKF